MILFLDRLINIPEFYNLIDKKNSILDETERMFIRNSSFISNSENKFRHFKQILVRGLSKSYNTCILFIYIYVIKKDISNVGEYKSFLRIKKHL